MAELIFRDMVERQGLSSEFRISSFGTSDEEEGHAIYYPAQKTLALHGITGSHRAQQLTLQDVEQNDYILVMDENNLRDVLRLTGGKYSEKIYKLCSFTDRDRNVADPWYTRDFERAYCDIEDGCRGFLHYLLDHNLVSE